MIFHNAGKYDGDESHLPQREHHPNAVPFKEPEDMKKLAIIGNVGSIVVFIVLMIPFIFLRKQCNFNWLFVLAAWMSCLTLVPHEFLHALCFKKDVYMYSNLSQGLMFVVGTEDMSKAHFVFMSLLPNIVFGVIPYILFLLFPGLTWLGIFGAICVGMGFGDYINVYNALTQMPKHAKTYMCGLHSFWYVEDN